MQWGWSENMVNWGKKLECPSLSSFIAKLPSSLDKTVASAAHSQIYLKTSHRLLLVFQKLLFTGQSAAVTSSFSSFFYWAKKCLHFTKGFFLIAKLKKKKHKKSTFNSEAFFLERPSFSHTPPWRSARTLRPRRSRAPSVQRAEDTACWFKMAEGAWKRPPSWAAGHRHHAGHRRRDPWNACDRLMNNTMVHCYDAGCLPGTCPCNYPQQNQLSGSHNSLGLIRGGFGTTRQGTV